jgi:transcriptional regulator with XRE-family HTH domain
MSHPKTNRRGRRSSVRAFPNLMTWRKTHKLNQHEAAKELGLTQSSYSRLERGVKIPVRDDLKRIVDLTGVPIEVLVGVA